MISQTKFFLTISLFVATVQFPAYSNACEVPTPYILHNYGWRLTENCSVPINDEVSIQSNVLLNFDITEVKLNIISKFWVPFRDTLVEHRDAIGFINLHSLDAQQMQIRITNSSGADVAKQALKTYLKEANIDFQSFGISSIGEILTIKPSENWLSERINTQLEESMLIMRDRFAEVDVSIDIAAISQNAIVVSVEKLKLTERGIQFLINPGRFSINEIKFISDTIPDNLPLFTKAVKSVNDRKYYIITATPLVSNEKILTATPSFSKNYLPSLSIDFDDSDGTFFEYTAAHVGRPIAFVFDNVVISTPHISAPISNGKLQITSLPSFEIASTYSIFLNLPVLPISFSFAGEGISDKL